MVLKSFPYLYFNYSDDEYGDDFDCPEICLVCNKDYERSNTYKVSEMMVIIIAAKNFIVSIVGGV